MPTYRVVLRAKNCNDTEHEFKVTADDVDIDSDDESGGYGLFFNFCKGDEGTTVAAVPYDQVLYIAS